MFLSRQLVRPYPCQRLLTRNPVQNLVLPATNVVASLPQRRHQSSFSPAKVPLPNLGNLRHAPSPTIALGLSSIAPFVAAPYMMVHSGEFLPSWAYAQLVYGATVLSFIGGIRWGVLVAKPESLKAVHQYCWSVCPALLGWGALLMPSTALGSLTCTASLLAALYADLMPQAGYPDWLKALRLSLTSVAVLSLLLVLTCQVLLSEKRDGGSK